RALYRLRCLESFLARPVSMRLAPLRKALAAPAVRDLTPEARQPRTNPRHIHEFPLLLLALALMPLPAGRRPTRTAARAARNPRAGRLQIRRADGVVKTIVLRQGAQFEMYGTRVSPAQFRQGMQVAVRVVGALNDDPLEADLLTDYGSSSQYVATNATSP